MHEMNEIDGDEFDFMLEIIIAIIFMSIGIFATIITVRTFTERVQMTPRVDKVEVNSNLIQENDPFDFTGYQAYMMAWHMDGLDDTTLMWTAGDTYMDIPAATDSGEAEKQATVIDPINHRSGFITFRNQMITGARIGKDKSVVDTLKACVPSGNKTKLVQLYRGLGDFANVRMQLSLTGEHVNEKSPVYDFSGQYIEERKVYKWTMCLPTKCTH